jgi:voltage-gated potassium channel
VRRPPATEANESRPSEVQDVNKRSESRVPVRGGLAAVLATMSPGRAIAGRCPISWKLWVKHQIPVSADQSALLAVKEGTKGVSSAPFEHLLYVLLVRDLPLGNRFSAGLNNGLSVQAASMPVPVNFEIFRKIQRSLLYLLAVFVVSVVGYLTFGWSLIDSVYMVVITMFGVGFGEVHPLITVWQKIFTMLVIIGGTSAVVFVIGEIIRFIAEGEVLKAIAELKKSRQVEGVSQHAIICGYGRIGQILAHDLAAYGFPFVVVDKDDERLAIAEAAGYLFVKGSATEEETLIQAGAERAHALATVLPQDTLNVFITLTARNLNRNLRIIARGEQPSTEKKLLQAGANEVVLPAAIGGSRIAHIITRPATMNFLGDSRGILGEELSRLGVEIDELRLHQHTPLVGKTVQELQDLGKGNLLVLAIQRADGSVLRGGFLEEQLRDGDAVIIVGRKHALPSFLRAETDREELL